MPMAENCAATALPAGPVPPITPIRTLADLHVFGSEVDPGGLSVGPVAPDAPLGGVDLEGRRVDLSLSERVRGLLFVTSACSPCQPLWIQGRLAGGQAGLVWVTPDAETESPKRLRELAGDALEVVMCSQAWFYFSVGAAPWLVTCDQGRVLWSGPAPQDWDSLVQALRLGRAQPEAQL